VEAFKSTLEVASEADVLVHVVDGSSADPQGQIDAVRLVLAEIGADQVPEILAFNKADVAPDMAKMMVERHPGSVDISARTGAGLDDLLQTLADRLRSLAKVVELFIPYERGDVLAAVHREGEVISTADEPTGVRVRARLDPAAAGKLTAQLATA
jgi:GTP-binding protein HflX